MSSRTWRTLCTHVYPQLAHSRRNIARTCVPSPVTDRCHKTKSPFGVCRRDCGGCPQCILARAELGLLSFPEVPYKSGHGMNTDQHVACVRFISAMHADRFATQLPEMQDLVKKIGTPQGPVKSLIVWFVCESALETISLIHAKVLSNGHWLGCACAARLQSLSFTPSCGFQSQRASKGQLRKRQRLSKRLASTVKRSSKHVLNPRKGAPHTASKACQVWLTLCMKYVGQECWQSCRVLISTSTFLCHLTDCVWPSVATM